MATIYMGTLPLGQNKKEPDKEAIKRLASLGFDRRRIARKMRVPYSTLCAYIADKQSYKDAFEEGRDEYLRAREKFVADHGGADLTDGAK